MTEVDAHRVQRRRAKQQMLLITFWLTLLVLSAKASAGWAANSLSIKAEALHTLIDSFSALLSFMAVSLPSPLADRPLRSHGWGETVLVLLLAAIGGCAGLTLSQQSLVQLWGFKTAMLNLSTIQVSPQLIQLMVVTALISGGLALFQSYEARQLDSLALHTSAVHVLQDLWLTGVMVLGLIGISLGYFWLDPLIALIMFATAISSMWRMLVQQLPCLVEQTGIAAEAIDRAARRVRGVIYCRLLRSRGLVGQYLLLELQLSIHPDFRGSAQGIAHQVDRLLRERYGPLETRIYLSFLTDLPFP